MSSVIYNVVHIAVLLCVQITNNAECVLNVQALELDPDDQTTTTVLHQLQRVVRERDTYAQVRYTLHWHCSNDLLDLGLHLCLNLDSVGTKSRAGIGQFERDFGLQWRSLLEEVT